MPIKATIKCKCPYCDNVFDLLIDDAYIYSRHRVVLCDTEETEGCDRYFVIEYRAKVMINQVYKMQDIDMRSY